MALIGTIRKNSWILVVMIALGLGGFIIMDVSSAGGAGGQTEFTIGEVNGDKIDWNDFRKAQDAMYSQSDVDLFDQREFVWNYMIEEKIVNEEADAIGLRVGEEEMQELIYGANISPVVLRNFSDPQTGQLNREVLDQFRTASQAGTLSPQFQRVWDFQFDEIEKTRLQDKLVQLVKKDIYTPTWMAENIQKEVGSSIDFKYVMVPFGQIDDTEIEITEEDYKTYIKSRSDAFMRDAETRNAVYTVFEVFPTAEDSMLIRERLQVVKDEFAATENDSTFVVNSGAQYLPDYILKDNLPFFIQDTLWTLSKGQIYGPYLDPHDGTFKITKVLDRRIQPDSAKVRHILIGVERQEQVPAAILRADSVETLLEQGVPFDSLAMRYSNDDGSKVNGGDLGWIAEARYIKPFNDAVFHADLETNKIKRVFSEFGIHIVEVLDYNYESNSEGIRTANIMEAIIPSEATQDYMYDDVLEFAGQNRTVEQLIAAADADDRTEIQDALGIGRNDYIFGDLGASENSRGIIRWLFDSDTKVTRVAPEVFIFEHPERYFNQKYVVAGLESINKPGLPTPDQVMNQIESEVANQKKAEVIASRIAGQGMSAISDNNNKATVDTVKNVNFGLQMLGDIGNEPKVIGTAVNMSVGQTSEPIIGRNGVYVIEIIKYTPASAAQNLPRLRDQGSFQIASAASRELLPALKHKAEIDDNRFTYY